MSSSFVESPGRLVLRSSLPNSMLVDAESTYPDVGSIWLEHSAGAEFRQRVDNVSYRIVPGVAQHLRR